MKAKTIILGSLLAATAVGGVLIYGVESKRKALIKNFEARPGGIDQASLKFFKAINWFEINVIHEFIIKYKGDEVNAPSRLMEKVKKITAKYDIV